MINFVAPGWPSPTCSGGDLKTHTKRTVGGLLGRATYIDSDGSSMTGQTAL
jgi:hypothetical protein